MTIEELRQKLDELNDNQFHELISKVGGTFQNRAEFVDHFVHRPNDERLICHHLKLPTEEEKITQAAIDASKSAKRSAIAAVISAGIALIALIITVLSL